MASYYDVMAEAQAQIRLEVIDRRSNYDDDPNLPMGKADGKGYNFNSNSLRDVIRSVIDRVRAALALPPGGYPRDGDVPALTLLRNTRSHSGGWIGVWINHQLGNTP